MKKLNLLLVVALLASALLMAATPLKLVRLTVINQTGAPIYIKLTGVDNGMFYYLTVPADADKDSVLYPWNKGMTFTIMTGEYLRTTYACDYAVSGKLLMTSNVKLNFVPCDTRPMKTVYALDCDQGEDGCEVCEKIEDGDPDKCTGEQAYVTKRVVNRGEPTMETISYFKYWWSDLSLCADADFLLLTFRTPGAVCLWRYR